MSEDTAARGDYPPARCKAPGVHMWDTQYEAMCDEIDALRAIAREAWEWDDGDRLPGRLPELLDVLGWSTP